MPHSTHTHTHTGLTRTNTHTHTHTLAHTHCQKVLSHDVRISQFIKLNHQVGGTRADRVGGGGGDRGERLWLSAEIEINIDVHMFEFIAPSLQQSGRGECGRGRRGAGIHDGFGARRG